MFIFLLNLNFFLPFPISLQFARKMTFNIMTPKYFNLSGQSNQYLEFTFKRYEKI